MHNLFIFVVPFANVGQEGFFAPFFCKKLFALVKERIL